MKLIHTVLVQTHKKSEVSVSDLKGNLICTEIPANRNFPIFRILPLRMSATGSSYTQMFFKVQYIIIQATLSRKSTKKFGVTDEKVFRICKAFDRKKVTIIRI